jgi:hypothetical protein
MTPGATYVSLNFDNPGLKITYSSGHSLGAFPRGDVDKGLPELDQPVDAMIEDLVWWTAALKASRKS